MLTSAAAPAFDKKKNRGGDNSTRIANLLGVAATDVPIENIARLTLPYRVRHEFLPVTQRINKLIFLDRC